MKGCNSKTFEVEDVFFFVCVEEPQRASKRSGIHVYCVERWRRTFLPSLFPIIYDFCYASIVRVKQWHAVNKFTFFWRHLQSRWFDKKRFSSTATPFSIKTPSISISFLKIFVPILKVGSIQSSFTTWNGRVELRVPSFICSLLQEFFRWFSF